MARLSASTYDFIASQTTSGTATSVTFSNIPQNFTDLEFTIVGTTTHSDNGGRLYIRMNGDSSASYSGTWMGGTGSTTTSSRDTGESYGSLGPLGNSGQMINTFTIFNSFSYKYFNGSG